MNRDKINKVAIIAAANYDNPFDEPAYDKKFYDGFMVCADWLMQQPLSERLTDEEKEKIRAMYNRKITYTSEMAKKYAEVDLLVAIFGIDFFEREK